MAPSNEDELQDMIASGIAFQKPSFIRYPRGNGTGVKLKSTPTLLEIGKARVIQEGEEICFWALGSFLETAKEIADSFTQKYGFTPTIVDPRFVKPLDEDLLREQASRHNVIITIEDNVLVGGFGTAVLEFIQTLDEKPLVQRIGWPDEFIEHGSSVNSLRKKYMLDSKSILKSVELFLNHAKIKCKSVLA